MKIKDYLQKELSTLDSDYKKINQITLSHQNEYNQAKTYYDQCLASPDYLNHPDVLKRNRLKAMFGGGYYANTHEEAKTKLLSQHIGLAFSSPMINAAKFTLDKCYSDHISPGNSTKNEIQPIKISIQKREAEIKQLLDIMPKLEQQINTQEGLVKQITDMQRQSQELQLKQERNLQESKKLKNEVDKFSLDDVINSYNSSKKAHILYKIWKLQDSDSIKLKESIIKLGFDPHYTNKDGKSLIALSIEQNNPKLFKLLIENKLEFNHCFGNDTIFDLVMKNGDTVFIKIMLDSGEHDFTKIAILNILKGDVDYVANLLDKLPNWQEFKYQGEGLLHFAMRTSKTQMAKIILNKDTSILNEENDNGLTALDIAIVKQDLLGVKLLKEHGVNLTDSFGTIANQLAANNMSDFLMNILVEYSELLGSTDKQKNNLVHLSCKYGHHELAGKLLSKNAELLNQTNDFGETPLHLIVQAKTIDESKQLLSVLVPYNPDINFKNLSDKSFVNLLDDHSLMLAHCYEIDLLGNEQNDSDIEA